MSCEKLFETIESLKEEYLQFLIDVCNIESPTDYKEGVDKVGQYFAAKAIQKGWQTEFGRQEISGDTLCITMNPNAKGAPVCFSGHMDTVHPVGSFGENPVHIEDDKIYGPGVTDCKGGLVVAFMVMDALERIGFNTRPVKLILQSDEENGSRNSNKTTVDFMYEHAKGCVVFLNAEPGVDNAHCVSRKGIRKYRFEITGKSVHSSKCNDGVSAIAEAAHKILQLEKFKDTNSITCNCGLINGGSAENTVPESCIFTADFRYKTKKECEEIDKLVQEVASHSYVEGTSCKAILASYRVAYECSEEIEELFKIVRKIYLENGLGDVQMVSALGGSDAGDMAVRGIPSLDNFGIFGANIHNLAEYAYIDSLVVAAKRLGAVTYSI